MVETTKGIFKDASGQRISYAGVEFPQDLITRESLLKKQEKARRLGDRSASTLSTRDISADAGDRHGTYHNEAMWYAEQEAGRLSEMASSMHNSIRNPVIAESIGAIRENLEHLGMKPKEKVTLTSRVTLQYSDDPRDTEIITLVPPLDEEIEFGLTSVLAPIARAIEGKKKGEQVDFKANKQAREAIRVTIKEIE